MGKSCFFIGHRKAPPAVMPLLLEEIDRHVVEHGVTAFYVGHYGAFDRMAAAALAECKQRHAHITAHLVLAYHPALRQVKIPQGLDGSILLDGQEKAMPRFAVVTLNRRMIRQSDHLIAYVRLITEGSRKLLDYADAREQKGQLVITNLANTGAK